MAKRGIQCRVAKEHIIIEESSAPDLLSSAIVNLWRKSHGMEKRAFRSRAFKSLERNCRKIYSPINGSRLPPDLSAAAGAIDLQSALHNFFRWSGAPWYGGDFRTANEIALRLHRAFLSSQINRTYFVPLDRLSLMDRSVRPHKNVKNIHFGPNEVVLLTSAELRQRIPQDGLKRFGHQFEFPIERLDDRYWLIVTTVENAGVIWERTWRRFMYHPIDTFGKSPMFKSTFPNEIEEAILVLLLSWKKEPIDRAWNPFTIPWVYSLTNDTFARPNPAPNPSALSWDLVGDHSEVLEVPDQSEIVNLTDDKIDSIRQRWSKLQTVLRKTDAEGTSFHPLTLHFFIKAFSEEGIDEIIATISCIEATLQLPEERNRTELMKRYRRLVNADNCYQWLDNAFKLRREYIHSLGNPKATIIFKDLARTRLSLINAVDAYIDLASRCDDRNRTELLRFLSNQQASEN